MPSYLHCVFNATVDMLKAQKPASSVETVSDGLWATDSTLKCKCLCTDLM